MDCDQDIVTWCVEVIGARDLSRYDQFGSLRDDPNALAVTLAVETLRLLAAGTIPPAADSNERTSDGDAPNRDR